jgi:glycosyltransferase involved in cell wall biosynthesis
MRRVVEARPPARPRVTMLLENDLFPEDVRVRDEAQSLVAAGYEVRVIAPRGARQARTERLDGVTVERYWLPMSEGGSIAGLLAEYIVAHAQLFIRGTRSLLRGADFLHCHNPPDTLFPLALPAHRLHRRFVFDQHDLFSSLFEQRIGRGPLWRIADFANRTMIRNADIVLVTNGTHLENVRRRHPRPGAQVVLVRNGPRQSTVSARPPAIRPGRLLDPKLVYVGALEPQDGVDQLPHLLERLVVDHGLTGVRLSVAGWGSELDALRSDFASRGLLHRVRLLGRTPHGEVLRLIADADICLDPAPPTRFNHGTTMVKISEYLALGRPTVSYALRETAKTAAGAVSLVPGDDPDAFARRVAELAGSGATRAELHRRAAARAPDLVWERQAARMVGAYDSLARRDGLKPATRSPARVGAYPCGPAIGAMLADGARFPAGS